MASLFADENYDYPVVDEIRKLGHDVLTTQEAGRAGQRIPDEDQLTFATSQGRAIITFNRRHFLKLHRQSVTHAGIIVCTKDSPIPLAERVHKELQKYTD